jgi:muconolactone delta-isomerase
MLFMLINQTRSDLSPEEFQRLGELAKAFYANIPENVTLHADWAALDRSRTFALLEADEQGAIEAIQAPFRPYVEIEIIPVRRLSGWEVS